MSYIHLENVGLTFTLQKERRIKDFLLHPFQKAQLPEEWHNVTALQNINLRLQDGDRLGVVGHNGAGKSTLLKMMAGIYPPTEGLRETEGHIACLFELATGFEMEATGWENIKLRGLMLGLTPHKIAGMAAEIGEFSGLGKFLDMPVKYYSSGMFIRLAFSISTSISPDILLLDEVIAAGDAAFLEKSKQRMRDMMDTVKVMVFVSHSMQAIKDFCNQAICLEQGQIIYTGKPAEVCDFYLDHVQSVGGVMT